MAYMDRDAGAGAGAARQNVVQMPFADAAAHPVTKVQRHSEHTVIFYEGDTADRLFELEDGIVMLFKLLPDGRRQVVEILKPGAIFGLSAGPVYDVSAETLTSSRIGVLDRRDMDSSPWLQRQVTHCLLRQMETMHDHAMLLGRKSAAERVASFLMRMVPGRGGYGCLGPAEGGKDEREVALAMTRQEIADYLGLTIETVSRVISDMKRRGLISIVRQDRIRINNVCALCKATGIH